MKTLLLTFIVVATMSTKLFAVEESQSVTTQNPAPVDAVTPAPVAQNPAQTNDVPQLTALLQKGQESLDKVTKANKDLLDAKQDLADFVSKTTNPRAKALSDAIKSLSVEKGDPTIDNIKADAAVIPNIKSLDAKNSDEIKTLSKKVSNVLSLQKKAIEAGQKAEPEVGAILTQARRMKQGIDAGVASGKFTATKQTNAANVVAMIDGQWNMAKGMSSDANIMSQSIISIANSYKSNPDIVKAFTNANLMDHNNIQKARQADEARKMEDLASKRLNLTPLAAINPWLYFAIAYSVYK